MSTLPKSILPFLIPFATIFRTKKTFLKMLLLFSGCILCRGGRTVCGCLRALGMHGEKAFSTYHQTLNRCNWNTLQGAKQLLQLLLPFTKGQLILVVDEHLERRNGKKIKAKAIYRDAVASSHAWLVKCQGIKWVVLSCIVSFPWSKRPFALPFFSVLILPEHHSIHEKRKYRTGIDLLNQMLLTVRRWLPNESIVLVGDGDYARLKLAEVCIKQNITLITRLRSDARLYDYPNHYKGKGRPPKRGKKLSREDMPITQEKVSWYGGKTKTLCVRMKNCLWYAGKKGINIPIFSGWVEFHKNDEYVIACIGVESILSAKEIVEWYIKRWNLEVTFRECREHLGVETQRQWSDLAITRTTPILFGMYTLVTIIGHSLWEANCISPLKTAWYNKKHLTFSDMIRIVRTEIWSHISDSVSEEESEKSLTSRVLLSEYLKVSGF